MSAGGLGNDFVTCSVRARVVAPFSFRRLSMGFRNPQVGWRCIARLLLDPFAAGRAGGMGRFALPSTRNRSDS